MPVITPGRRPAFAPIGRLRSSPLSGGKKSGFASLNLTAMVDMFTILVIFLIQLFTSAGEVQMHAAIKVPRTVAGLPLEEPGTVVMMNNEGMLLLDGHGFAPSEMGSELDVAIPGMVAKLTEAREFREKIEGRDPTQPYQGILLIQADIKTDFRLVRRVLTSANESGWAKIKFVSIPAKSDKKPGEGGEGEAAEG